MIKKKAQLQMGENVIILFIFFFLLVIAVLFYARIQKTNIGIQSVELKKLSNIDLKTLLLNMPELKCVENGDETENCIDVINVEGFASYWNSTADESYEKGYYQYRFGKSKVVIKQFDAVKGNWTKNWTLYNSNITTNNYQLIIIPVSLFNPIKNDKDFGQMELTIYTLT